MQPSDSFDKRTQKLLAFFALFIAFPVFEIPVVGISITFPIFIWICHRVNNRTRYPLFALQGTLDKLMLVFVLMAALSIFAAPPADRGGMDLFIKDGKSFLYLSYWFTVYLFFRRWYRRIDIQQVSFYTLLGVVLSTIVVLLGNHSGGVLSLGPFHITQNSYAFNAVACMGGAAVFLLSRYDWKFVILYGAGSIYTMLLSDSRSGSIIITLQCFVVILVTLFKKRIRWRRNFVVGLVVCLVLFSLVGLTADLGKEIAWTLGSWVEPYSSEVAELLKDSDRVLERDTSWIIRKTQIEKGVDLFKKNPLLGVGWGHFTYVRGYIDFTNPLYKYLHRKYDDYALSRSSHNSYIQVLAETGIFGFVPFIMIQLYIVWSVFKSFVWSRSVEEVCSIGASLIGIAIYFWTISAVTGAVWYFVIGLFAGAVVDDRKQAKTGVLLSHSRPQRL